MPRNIILKENFYAARDLFLVAAVFAFGFFVSIQMDFFKIIVVFDTAHPQWHIGDIIIATVISFFALVWYAVRRWHGVRREAVSLLKTVQDVEAQNKTIEDTAHKLVIALATAKAASQAKSQFLSNMSHELRTPLNAIIGFTELIAKCVSRTGWLTSYTEYLSDVTDSGKHLLDLINTILDLAKIETGHLELDREPVNLCELVEASVKLVSGMARNEGISIATEIPADCPDIEGDFLKLKQVFLNVLSNAVKFTAGGGKIEVRVTFTGAYAVIAVIDTGCGISKEDVSRVMQPFFQADNSLSRKFGGSGLGLSIARDLCVLHGGKLELTSVVGQGTTVLISLPKTVATSDVRQTIAA